MNRKIIFCKNYGQIKTVLYLAEHHTPDLTIVVVGNHDLFKFFQVIDEKVFHNTINLIDLEIYRPKIADTRGIKKLFPVLPDIIRERRYLKESFNKYFAGMEDCEVFFFSRAFGGAQTFYFIKKLSKKNKVVHISGQWPNIAPMRQHTPGNVLEFMWLMISKLVYGPDVALGKVPTHGSAFLYIPDKYLNKVVDRFISWEEQNEWIKDFDSSRFKVFDVGDYDVIYFGHTISPAMVSHEILIKTLIDVYGILLKYFHESKIACKYHPEYPIDETVMDIGRILPSFIPAEFLYKDSIKMYLSIWSTSISSVEKGLPVSIMDLIPINREDMREPIKEQLVKMSRTEILFPKSLEEFEKIVADVKHQTA